MPSLLVRCCWNLLGDVYQLYCVVCWFSRLFLGLSCVCPTSLVLCSSRKCTGQIEVMQGQSPVEVLDEFYGCSWYFHWNGLVLVSFQGKKIPTKRTYCLVLFYQSVGDSLSQFVKALRSLTESLKIYVVTGNGLTLPVNSDYLILYTFSFSKICLLSRYPVISPRNGVHQGRYNNEPSRNIGFAHGKH